MTLSPGGQLGPYTLTAQLGHGGMGVVYTAHDPRLDRQVAIKVLPPDLTRDATAKQRFLQEAQAASALDHPNICTIRPERRAIRGGLDAMRGGLDAVRVPFGHGDVRLGDAAHLLPLTRGESLGRDHRAAESSRL